MSDIMKREGLDLLERNFKRKYSNLYKSLLKNIIVDDIILAMVITLFCDCCDDFIIGYNHLFLCKENG